MHFKIERKIFLLKKICNEFCFCYLHKNTDQLINCTKFEAHVSIKTTNWISGELMLKCNMNRTSKIILRKSINIDLTEIMKELTFRQSLRIQLIVY